MSAAPILSFDEVSYRYPGAEAAALQRVCLELQEGEVCLLAGLSGGGKSTLLRAACGLVPHFHGGSFAGRVTVCGHDTREHGPAQIGAHAAVLFQDPETQLVMSSVRAELALALQSRGQSPDAVARGVEEVALAIGVDHLLHRRTAELSGGEKQRVALAAALAGRPRIVLLDEPTSQLDPVAGEELFGLLRRLNQEWETSILIAEHRLERCLHLADRVIAMANGCVAHDGDPVSFLSWAGKHAEHLQTPAARLLELAGVDAPPPTGVRQARSSLRALGLLPEEGSLAAPASLPSKPRRTLAGLAGRRLQRGHEPALRMRGVWHELKDGPAILRGVDLTLVPGEVVALMGANPGDYFLHERVELEASAAAIEGAGLAAMSERNPRDLSGGERQRLALAIVTDSQQPPAVLALDEPTRGMDRGAKAALAQDLRRRAQEGMAVIVATHDPEFAAACAQRAVLLAGGGVIADASCAELLSGCWYFATETARILGGHGSALLPQQGAQAIADLAGARSAA